MEIPEASTLPSVAWDRARDMPPVRAVYLLLDASGQTIYAGRSECVVKRCGSYSRPKLAEMGVARIAWWECADTSELIAREVSAIRKLRPARNVTSHPCPEDAEGTVPIRAVADALGWPTAVVHDLVRRGLIPSVDVTREWHQTKRYRFRLSDVQAALTLKMEPAP
jgi:hypothetical protein